MVQPMDYSFKEISILIKKNLALLANEHWVVRLHRPTSDSVTGGKLRHCRTIKADPNPSPYFLAPLGPGQRWVVGSLRAGCLPLAVETGRYRSPKVPLVDRVCTLCDTGCVEDEIHFITTCRALHNERYNLFCRLARVYSKLLLLNNYEKTLCPQTQMCALLPKVYITCTNSGCHYCRSS